MDKDKFPSNAKFLHNHTAAVTHMRFCDNGEYFTSTCANMTKLYKVAGSLFGCFCTMETKDYKQEVDKNVKPLSCVDNSGNKMVTYRGHMKLNVFSVKEVGQDRVPNKERTVELLTEI